MGFVIGMAASGLVSRFFETRKFQNLWGLTAKKKIIDKTTFGNLEWIASIIIGFLVFEIMTKIVKKKMDEMLPSCKNLFFRWIIRKQIHEKLTLLQLKLNTQKILLLTMVHQGTKNAFDRFSKK